LDSGFIVVLSFSVMTWLAFLDLVRARVQGTPSKLTHFVKTTFLQIEPKPLSLPPQKALACSTPS
jgi:hypothetical protein